MQSQLANVCPGGLFTVTHHVDFDAYEKPVAFRGFEHGYMQTGNAYSSLKMFLIYSRLKRFRGCRYICV